MNHVEIVKNLYREISTGQARNLGQYLADNFQFTGPVPTPLQRKDYIEFMTAVKQAFPDWTVDPQDLKEQGQKVTGYIQVRGTHRGLLNLSKISSLSQIPQVQPTNKKVQLPRTRIECTFSGDKISELRVDNPPGSGLMGILQQVGAQMPEEVEV